MGYDELSSKRIIAEPAAVTRVARPNPWPRRIFALLLILGTGGYFAMNSDAVRSVIPAAGEKAAGAQGGAAPGRGRGGGNLPPVRVATAELRDVPVTVRTIGTVLANSIVTVKSQIDGPLLSVHFKEGQMVKKGDLLFRIDPLPFEATVRQNEAQVARDQAQLASAQADADRAIMLADRGIVSTQQRDQLVANAKALAATVLADRAVLERGRLNLGYTTIRAPIDGKTGAYNVYPGNQIHANDQAGLITITQIQPVKITFNLPQANLPLLQDRMRENALIASLTLRSDVTEVDPGDVSTSSPEMSIPVRVDFIDNTIDARTGTIELRATFANPDLRFVPGELIDVSVRLDTLSDAVVVPHEAVNAGQNGPYIFVVKNDDTVEMRPVNIVYEDAVLAALGSGIAAGERAVVDGQLRLSPGTRVSVVPNLGEAPAGTAGQVSEGSDGRENAAPASQGNGRGQRGG